MGCSNQSSISHTVPFLCQCSQSLRIELHAIDHKMHCPNSWELVNESGAV